MTKIIINLDNIEFIKLFNKREHSNIQWRVTESKKFNWKTFKFEITQKFGYYDNGYPERMYIGAGLYKHSPYLTLNELKEKYPDLLVEDGIVYNPPKVELFLKSGNKQTKIFTNYSEANAFYQSLNRKLTNKIEL